MLKKVIALLIAISLLITYCFSNVIFAGASGDVDIDTGEDAIMTTYQIPNVSDFYKTQGRTSIINDGLSLDYTASSIEFNANLPVEGQVVLNVTTSSISAGEGQGLYFTVVVDGVVKNRDDFRVTTNGDTTLTLATGLSAGNHTFAVYRQTEIERGQVLVKAINLSNGGILLPKPSDKDLYIEFVGDSLTTGYGNLTTSSVTGSSVPSASAPIYQDGTKAFAFLAAKQLNADYSIVAQQGIGAYVGYQAHNTYQAYLYTRYIRDKSTLWDFTRQPDVVVITLGGNDAAKYSTVSPNDFKTGFANLLSLVRSKNPNAKIVWANRPDLLAAVTTVIQTVISEAGGADSGYFYTPLSLDHNGGNGHPTTASDVIAAGELKAFIQNTVLGGSGNTPGDINGDGEVDLKDVTTLSRHIAGWTGLTVTEELLDTNGDGQVDLKDVTLLSRFIAGWDVSLGGAK